MLPGQLPDGVLEGRKLPKGRTREVQVRPPPRAFVPVYRFCVRLRAFASVYRFPPPMLTHPPSQLNVRWGLANVYEVVTDFRRGSHTRRLVRSRNSVFLNLLLHPPRKPLCVPLLLNPRESDPVQTRRPMHTNVRWGPSADWNAVGAWGLGAASCIRRTRRQERCPPTHSFSKILYDDGLLVARSGHLVVILDRRASAPEKPPERARVAEMFE